MACSQVTFDIVLPWSADAGRNRVNRVLNAGIALGALADTLDLGIIPFALIETFVPVSGAHFNPAVTVATAICGTISWRRAALYVPMQIVGGLTGTFFPT